MIIRIKSMRDYILFSVPNMQVCENFQVSDDWECGFCMQYTIDPVLSTGPLLADKGQMTKIINYLYY